MADFTTKLRTEEADLDLCFKENAADSEAGYTVTVMDDDYALPPFIIRQVNGAWRIANKMHLPLWIVAMETVLEQMIISYAGS